MSRIRENLDFIEGRNSRSWLGCSRPLGIVGVTIRLAVRRSIQIENHAYVTQTTCRRRLGIALTVGSTRGSVLAFIGRDGVTKNVWETGREPDGVRAEPS
ncbi:hypothetical protein ACFX2C_007773 [Malus domestica]